MSKNAKYLNLIAILFIISLIHPSICFTQQHKIDSLKNLLVGQQLPDSSKLKVYLEISSQYDKTDSDSSIFYIHLGLYLCKHMEDTPTLCHIFSALGNYYNRNKRLDSMKYYYNHSLQLALMCGYNDEQASIYNSYAVYHMDKSNYDTALVFAHQALKISEEIKDSSLIPIVYNNLGIIHYHLENYDKSLYYYNKSLFIRELLNDEDGKALIYNNIGILYYFKSDTKKSVEYFEKALEIYRKGENFRQMALPLFNIAELYAETGKYKQALSYLWEVYAIENKLNDIQGKANTLLMIGSIQSKQGLFEESIKNQMEGIRILKSVDAKKDLAEAYLMISETYELTGNDKISLEFYKKYSQLSDTIMNEDKIRLLTEVETRYETEKKEQQIIIQEAQLAEKDAKVKQQTIQKIAFIIASILLSLLVFAVYRSYRIKKKANIILANQKEEIESQRDEIEAQRNMVMEQKEEIEKHQKEIHDSIRYAQRIQSAIMPPDEYLNKIFPEHFILNFPRNIVSGDFYWVINKGNKIYFAIADCTGHGVPGGFMSMMGISFLNEIMNEPGTMHTNNILDLLRKYVIDSLHQTGETGGMKDGMDISMCIYNKQKHTLEFSGAFSNVYIYQDEELLEIRGDKMPIGFYRSKADAPFTKHTVEVRNNAMIYLFTDGYIDQFGGSNGDKFKTENLKTLLQLVHNKSMAEQKEILHENHILWKGKYDQIDDILILGVRLNSNQDELLNN